MPDMFFHFLTFTINFRTNLPSMGWQSTQPTRQDPKPGIIPYVVGAGGNDRFAVFAVGVIVVGVVGIAELLL